MNNEFRDMSSGKLEYVFTNELRAEITCSRKNRRLHIIIINIKLES